MPSGSHVAGTGVAPPPEACQCGGSRSKRDSRAVIDHDHSFIASGIPAPCGDLAFERTTSGSTGAAPRLCRVPALRPTHRQEPDSRERQRGAPLPSRRGRNCVSPGRGERRRCTARSCPHRNPLCVFPVRARQQSLVATAHSVPPSAPTPGLHPAAYQEEQQREERRRREEKADR
jgi:hypothetical protein